MTPDKVKDFARKALHLDVVPVQIPGSTMFACEVDVSPKWAEDWLANHNTKNRNQRQGTVNRYASDMKAGRWIVSHQGIAFDESGVIVSGQHRLSAVVKSGVALRTLVFLNCPKEERNVIDQTAARNVRDVANLGHGEHLSADVVAAARAMAYGMAVRAGTQMTPQETYDFIVTHRASLDFVIGKVSRNVAGVTSATIVGAICRAFYHMKRADVAHFIEVLVEGFSLEDADRPVILLRNWLLENRAALRNTEGRTKAYGRTEAALIAYKNRENPARLSDPKEETFKLPSVKAA